MDERLGSRRTHNNTSEAGKAHLPDPPRTWEFGNATVSSKSKSPKQSALLLDVPSTKNSTSSCNEQLLPPFLSRYSSEHETGSGPVVDEGDAEDYESMVGCQDHGRGSELDERMIGKSTMKRERPRDLERKI